MNGESGKSLTLKMRLIIKNLTNLQTEKDLRENCI